MRGNQRPRLEGPMDIGGALFEGMFYDEHWEDGLVHLVGVSCSVLLSSLFLGYLCSALGGMSTWLGLLPGLLAIVGTFVGCLSLLPLVVWVVSYCVYLMAAIPIAIADMLLWLIRRPRKKKGL